MIGYLPKSLEVCGKEWKIDSDYRNILTIFTALSDESLSDKEKLYITLSRMYDDFDEMPISCYQEAYEKVTKFIECHDRSDDKKNPQLIDWEKDEHMIFPAINNVAGREIREVEYMHWWTFLGYFENVDNESLWSYVLSIRQKKAKGKKLEKYEQEFFNNNRDICSVERKVKAQKVNDELASMFDELIAEGG